MNIILLLTNQQRINRQKNEKIWLRVGESGCSISHKYLKPKKIKVSWICTKTIKELLFASYFIFGETTSFTNAKTRNAFWKWNAFANQTITPFSGTSCLVLVWWLKPPPLCQLLSPFHSRLIPFRQSDRHRHFPFSTRQHISGLDSKLRLKSKPKQTPKHLLWGMYRLFLRSDETIIK